MAECQLKADCSESSSAGKAVRVAVALTAFALLCAPEASAQWGLWPADSLLAEGHLAAAESVYYAAVRQNPRDPRARAALGQFLAARGGTRAGLVLIEEAQFFGGDSATLSRLLVPLYARLGDYEGLDKLKPDVLSSTERRRSRWLATHRRETRLQDSAVAVSYRPIGDGRGIGTVIVRLGRAELPAIIDPRVTGLIVPAALRREVRTFGPSGDITLGVSEYLRVGSVVFSNVPTAIGAPDAPVRIGFDVFAPFYPGFDPVKGIMRLRRVDRRAPSPAGIRVPALYDTNGMRLLIAGRWRPTGESAPSMLLSTRAWMWDWKLGDVVLAP